MSSIVYRASLAFVILGSAMGSATVAVAQGTEIRLGAGVNAPIASFADRTQAGARAGATFAAGLQRQVGSGRFAFRGEVSMHNFCTATCATAASGATYQVLAGGVAGVYTPVAGSRLAPYLVTGVGLTRFSARGVHSTESAPRSAVGAGLTAGAGVNLDLGRVGLFAEGRYQLASATGDRAAFLPATLGVRLGGR